MDELSPRARALLADLRASEGPDRAARGRVRQALLTSFGVTTLGATAAVPAAAATKLGATVLGKVAVSMVVGAVAGVAVVAPVVYVNRRPAPEVPSRLAQRPSPPVRMAEAPRALPSSSAPTTEEVRPPEPMHPAAASSTALADVDTLAGETRLLHEAWAKLKAGDPAGSLAALAEHERAYPSGALAEEAMAAKVLALCAAGRGGEARTWAERFAERFPGSPLGARVAGACRRDAP